MEAHAYGVTELARLALLSDDFLDLDELLATPADEQDVRKQRMASLVRMLSSGRELAALPTAERVLLLRSLFDRCLTRNVRAPLSLAWRVATR